LVIAGEGLSQTHFVLCFNLTEIDQLYDSERKYQLSKKDISVINPNTKNCPTFENGRDADLTINIYRNVGALKIENKEEGNPWGISFSVMFNKSNDSNLFETFDDLVKKGLELDSRNRLIGEGTEYFPIYESKFFHQYDHRFATYDLENRDDTRKVSLEEKDESDFAILPRHWLEKEEYEEKFRSPWHIALRNITNATNERTVICSLLPDVPTVHSMNHILDLDTEEAALMMACMNSYALDYVARQKVGNTNLSQFIIKQLPVPDPDHFENILLDGEPVKKRLVELSIMLACNADDLKGYMNETGLSTPYKFSEPTGEDREQLRIELEAIIFHLYGLSSEDFEQLFDSFDQIKRKDIDEYGYYRTRDEIKDRYEEIAPKITDMSEVDQ
jgi:hypothetical protein